MTTTSFHTKDNLRKIKKKKKKTTILWVSVEVKTHLIREEHEKSNFQSLTGNPPEF